MPPEDTPIDAPPPEEPDRSGEALLPLQEWAVDVPPEEPPPAEPPPAAPPETPPSPVRIIEALLFTGGPPLTAAQACDIIRGLTEEQFQQALDTLNHDYRSQGRPYAITP